MVQALDGRRADQLAGPHTQGGRRAQGGPRVGLRRLVCLQELACRQELERLLRQARVQARDDRLGIVYLQDTVGQLVRESGPGPAPQLVYPQVCPRALAQGMVYRLAPLLACGEYKVEGAGMEVSCSDAEDRGHGRVVDFQSSVLASP